MKLEP